MNGLRITPICTRDILHEICWKNSAQKMENLKKLELTELVDMLAEETSLYITMVKTGVSKDQFNECKEKIKQLQSEIKARAKNVDTGSLSSASPSDSLSKEKGE
jgi:gas vesicle protein